VLQTPQTGRVAQVEGSGSSAMTAARQWRLVWVLRVVPGTEPSTKGPTGRLACLNTCRRNVVSSGVLGKGATRSEGTSSGELAPSGGGLTMDTRGVLGAPGDIEVWKHRYRYGLGNCNWGTSRAPRFWPGAGIGGSREHTAEREQSVCALPRRLKVEWLCRLCPEQPTSFVASLCTGFPYSVW
jgi:hypothetical protein